MDKSLIKLELIYLCMWPEKSRKKQVPKAVHLAFMLQKENSFSFFSFFLFFLAMPTACRNSWGQGLNSCHNSDQSCCSDNAESLTCCSTRELPKRKFLKEWRIWERQSKDAMFNVNFFLLNHVFSVGADNK